MTLNRVIAVLILASFTLTSATPSAYALRSGLEQKTEKNIAAALTSSSVRTVSMNTGGAEEPINVALIDRVNVLDPRIGRLGWYSRDTLEEMISHISGLDLRGVNAVGFLPVGAILIDGGQVIWTPLEDWVAGLQRAGEHDLRRIKAQVAHAMCEYVLGSEVDPKQIAKGVTIKLARYEAPQGAGGMILIVPTLGTGAGLEDQESQIAAVEAQIARIVQNPEATTLGDVQALVRDWGNLENISWVIDTDSYMTPVPTSLRYARAAFLHQWLAPTSQLPQQVREEALRDAEILQARDVLEEVRPYEGRSEAVSSSGFLLLKSPVQMDGTDNQLQPGALLTVHGKIDYPGAPKRTVTGACLLYSWARPAQAAPFRIDLTPKLLLGEVAASGVYLKPAGGLEENIPTTINVDALPQRFQDAARQTIRRYLRKLGAGAGEIRQVDLVVGDENHIIREESRLVITLSRVQASKANDIQTQLNHLLRQGLPRENAFATPTSSAAPPLASSSAFPRRTAIIGGSAALLLAGLGYFGFQATHPDPWSKLKFTGVSDPTEEAHLRTYLRQLAEEWQQSSDPAFRRWAVLVHSLEVDFRTERSTPPMSRETPFGIRGKTTSRNAEGYPDFTLEVNPDGMRLIRSQFRQPYGDVLIKAFIVKELGGIEFLREHPDLSRSKGMLYAWLTEALKPYIKNKTYEIPKGKFKNSRLGLLIQHYVAVLLATESAGYLTHTSYLANHGLGAGQWGDLIADTQASGIVEFQAELVEKAGPQHQDRLWRAAMLHYGAVIRLSQSDVDTVSEQQQLFNFAAMVEVEEGRADLTTQGIAIPQDPNTGLPPAFFMKYVREPEFYAPQPSDLEKKFGPVLSGLEEQNQESAKKGWTERPKQLQMVEVTLRRLGPSVDRGKVSSLKLSYKQIYKMREALKQLEHQPDLLPEFRIEAEQYAAQIDKIERKVHLTLFRHAARTLQSQMQKYRDDIEPYMKVAPYYWNHAEYKEFDSGAQAKISHSLGGSVTMVLRIDEEGRPKLTATCTGQFVSIHLFDFMLQDLNDLASQFNGSWSPPLRRRSSLGKALFGLSYLWNPAPDVQVSFWNPYPRSQSTSKAGLEDKTLADQATKQRDFEDLLFQLADDEVSSRNIIRGLEKLRDKVNSRPAAGWNLAQEISQWLGRLQGDKASLEQARQNAKEIVGGERQKARIAMRQMLAAHRERIVFANGAQTPHFLLMEETPDSRFSLLIYTEQSQLTIAPTAHTLAFSSTSAIGVVRKFYSFPAFQIAGSDGDIRMVIPRPSDPASQTISIKPDVTYTITIAAESDELKRLGLNTAGLEDVERYISIPDAKIHYPELVIPDGISEARVFVINLPHMYATAQAMTAPETAQLLEQAQMISGFNQQTVDEIDIAQLELDEDDGFPNRSIPQGAILLFADADPHLMSWAQEAGVFLVNVNRLKSFFEVLREALLPHVGGEKNLPPIQAAIIQDGKLFMFA